MPKPYVGSVATNSQHLLRVRIRKSLMRRIKQVAAKETEECGEHVTASDIARVALVNYLQVHQSLQRLNETIEDEKEDALYFLLEPEDGEEIFIGTNPMLP